MKKISVQINNYYVGKNSFKKLPFILENSGKNILLIFHKKFESHNNLRDSLIESLAKKALKIIPSFHTGQKRNTNHELLLKEHNIDLIIVAGSKATLNYGKLIIHQYNSTQHYKKTIPLGFIPADKSRQDFIYSDTDCSSAPNLPSPDFFIINEEFFII